MCNIIVYDLSIRIDSWKICTVHDSWYWEAFWAAIGPEGGGALRGVEDVSAKGIEACAEPGFPVAATGLSRNGFKAHGGGCRSVDPGDGQGQDSGERVDLGGMGQAGVFEVEAAGLGVAEQTFDAPASPVDLKRPPRLDGVGHHQQPFAAGQALGGQLQR